MTKKENETQRFWEIRAAHYDKLFWVKDENYLDEIIRVGKFKKTQIVLDVGTGTGIVARKLINHVKHVLAIDISHSMLDKGKWEGMSIIKWDIGNTLFRESLFDKITARMVFHHILSNLDRVLLRCYDVLKEGGEIIVAEGVPPTDDEEVISWYTNMFKLKEDRRTFSIEMLQYFLEKNGFVNIKTHIYIIERFSINNWLRNSGLTKARQEKIYKMHINANA